MLDFSELSLSQVRQATFSLALTAGLIATADAHAGVPADDDDASAHRRNG